MTASEWIEIAAAIRDRWPAAALPEGTIRQWGADLEDLPGAQVAAALDALYRDGREFPPNGGQIRAKVIELDVAAPEFAEVVVALRRVLEVPTFGATRVGGTDDEPEFAPVNLRQAALEAEHPLIGAFVDAVGWDQIHGLEGGSDEARLRAKWQAFVDRSTRDARLRGIPASGLRGLERTNDHGLVGIGAAAAKVRAALEP